MPPPGGANTQTSLQSGSSKAPSPDGGRVMARLGFVSSYPPTRCGLATFTQHLARSMVSPLDTAFVIRVVENASDDHVLHHSIPIVAHMHHGDPASVQRALAQLNRADVSIVQHEYGIYGGPDGNQVLEMLEGLTVPTIVVLHTVLSHPTPGQRTVLEDVVRLASAAVVMSQTARSTLLHKYHVDGSKVVVIPHGVDVDPPVVKDSAPRRGSRPVILTWGLLGPGKGIELGVAAMAQLRDLDPLPLYRVLGQTHPKVVARYGQEYRQRLESQAQQLGVESMVDLDGHYLGSGELARAIAQASVVLLPYRSRAQVTSGVLAEAVAAGKPVVATAQEPWFPTTMPPRSRWHCGRSSLTKTCATPCRASPRTAR